MRYKTKFVLAFWSIIGPPGMIVLAVLARKIIKNPVAELNSLAVTALFGMAASFVLSRLFPLSSTKGMTPEEEDAAYASRVSGTAIGVQLLCAVVALWIAGSKLQSGEGWDRDAREVLFWIGLFVILYPVRRQANRHLPSFRPGDDTLAFITVVSFLGQIVAAPVAFFGFVFLLGQLEYRQGWNGNFAAVCAIATMAYFGMHQWRRWARKRFPPASPTTTASPVRQPQRPPEPR